MKKKTRSFPLILPVVIFLLLTLVAVILVWQNWISAVDSVNTAQTPFSIASGESTTSIADRLESDGLIKSATAFKILVKITGSVGKIQAGDFNLSKSMRPEQIMEKLMYGVKDQQITLVEGLRVEEMAEKLNQKFGTNKSEFLKFAVEGYMFPDTYSFSKDALPEEIAARMQTNFNQKYTEELKNQIAKQGLTPEEGVVLASIVEREGRSDEVRQMIASILLRRFNIGMAINADATVQYLVGFQKTDNTWWKKHLTHQDLQTPSPYNTYLNPGLPPAPICNPSLSSLEAVAKADPDTPYLFYYHDSQGNSHYGRTLEEHNRNIANNP